MSDLTRAELIEAFAYMERYGQVGILDVRRIATVAMRRIDDLEAERTALREDVATVLRGFEEGVFVRSTKGDGEGDWAIKLFPFLKAMGRLQTACTARLHGPEEKHCPSCGGTIPDPLCAECKP